MPTKAQSIASYEYKRAVRTMGEGWRHIGPELRRGLVMANIVGVIRTQDDEIDPARVLAYFNELVEAADALLNKEI